jgi:hypothetical protein
MQRATGYSNSGRGRSLSTPHNHYNQYLAGVDEN